VWPNAAPKVNEFLKDNLGNETTYQMPDNVDEVWYLGLYKFFMKTPWVFQLWVYSGILAEINRHFTMHFTSLKNLIEFIIFLVPNVVQGVVWVINMIVKFGEMAARLLVCLFVWVMNMMVKFVNIIVRLFVCIFHFASPRRRMRARAFSPGARGASPVPELRRSIRQGVHVPSMFRT
jgi:hypothetical protein